MSRGGGRYSVENRARLERERQASYARALAASARLHAAAVRVEARRARGLSDSDTRPHTDRPLASSSSQEFTSWANAVEKQAELVERGLLEAEALERAATFTLHLRQIAASGPRGEKYSDTSAHRFDQGVASSDRALEIAELVASQLRAFPVEATNEERSSVEDLAERTAGMGPGHQNMMLTELKVRIQKVKAAVALRADAARRAEELLRSLDGLEGSEISDLRALLAQARAGATQLLDADETRIAAARAKAIEDDDREYVASALARSFASLGYEVEQQFADGSASDGPVFAFMPDSPAHAVEMRLEGGSYVYRLVRTADRSDPVRDAALEAKLCGDIGAISAAVGAEGLRMTLDEHHQPGMAAVQYVPEAGNRRRARRSSFAKLRERQR